VQNGTRLAAFELSGGGKLVSVAGSAEEGVLMGSGGEHSSTGSDSACSVVFLDPEGRVYTLHVPFHVAIPGGGDEGASGAAGIMHDEQLVKEFGERGGWSATTRTTGGGEEWLGVARVLKTETVRRRFLKNLLHTPLPSQELINAHQQLQDLYRSESRDESGPLVLHISKVLSVLRLYARLEGLWEVKQEVAEASYDEVVEVLGLDEEKEAFQLLQDGSGREWSGGKRKLMEMERFLAAMEEVEKGGGEGEGLR